MRQALPVLVVEDEELLLLFLKTALERGGVDAVGAATGAEALQVLEQGEVAGVVSDLRMPGEIGGAEIFDWVQRNRPELASRFVFMTGSACDPYAVAVQERTGAQFIEKPFQMAELIEVIRAMVMRSEQAHV
jgi:DNA-binding NtrC family response regulator